MNLVKVGDVFLNFDRVSMVREQRDPATRSPTGVLLVYFHQDRRARFRGAEAEALRSFLDANALSITVDSGGADRHP